MKTQWSGGRAPLTPTSSLDKDERLTTRPVPYPGNSVLGKTPSYLINSRLGALHRLFGRFGQETKLLPLSAVRPPFVPECTFLYGPSDSNCKAFPRIIYFSFLASSLHYTPRTCHSCWLTVNTINLADLRDLYFTYVRVLHLCCSSKHNNESISVSETQMFYWVLC
jgi:hypothetical protein